MKRNRILSALLAAALAASAALPAAAAAPTPEQAQEYVTAKGWMTGTEKGFEPQLPMSRAMVYEMFWKMEGKQIVDASMDYIDVAPDAWYAASARWATGVKLTYGVGDRRYDGDRAMTRAEALTVLYRYLKDHLGLELPRGGDAIGAYEDAAELREKAAWAVDAYQWACQSGVACLDDNAVRLDHTNQVKRGELAQMLTVIGENMDQWRSQPTPTATPTAAPTAKPSGGTASRPSGGSASGSSGGSAAQPTATATAQPTSAPTAKPTGVPTAQTTASPAVEPTATPAAQTTAAPTATPVTQPTAAPTAGPTATPAVQPTAVPTASPAATPTAQPTAGPGTSVMTGSDQEETPLITINPTVAGVNCTGSVIIQDGEVAPGSTVTVKNYGRGMGVWVVLTCGTDFEYEGETLESDAAWIASNPWNLIADTNISHVRTSFPVKVYQLKKESRPTSGGSFTFDLLEDFELIRSTGDISAAAVNAEAERMGLAKPDKVLYCGIVNMNNSFGYMGCINLSGNSAEDPEAASGN